MKYWNTEQQELIYKYYWCYTAITSAQTRNEIYVLLLPSFNQLIRQALYSTGLQYYTEDDIQDCLIHMHIKLLPRLTADKLQGALNYLWISTKRYIITFILTKRKPNIQDDVNNHYVYCSRTEETDYNTEIQDIRTEILQALDDKILEQKVVNKTNTIFLILLKEYVIANDFDVREFETYIQDRMNINKATYQSIMSRVGIRSKLFNEKLCKN